METKILKFKEFGLGEQIETSLEQIGYVDATQIQSQTIPYLLQGKDVIGQSQTGTGKTAAFGLPILKKINVDEKSVQAIVLCPTRELALQVADEMKKFSKNIRGLKIATIYGGESIEKQIRDVKSGSQIVIGTPGRIMDHNRRKTLKLGGIKIAVLDEADEMLNMGFEEDIEEIFKTIPEQKQTALFSATMNPRVLKISRKYLNNPKNVKIQSKELTVENIEQKIIFVKESAKEEATMRLIDLYAPNSCIVFCNTKRKADILIEKLKSKGYKAECLHGDIKQMQRNRIMKKMKDGELRVLVATDVVARGIDIKDLELVINYDIPQDEEYYVHRIGRTGRNGDTGKAFTFVVGREKNRIYSIEKYAKTKIKEMKLPTYKEVQKIKNKELVSEIQSIIDKNEFTNTEILESLLENNNSLESISKALLTKFLIINQIEEVQKQVNTKNYTSDEDGMVRLFVSVGKKDNIMVKDIVGSFAANSLISGSDIGKVKILDKFSFVDIPTDLVTDVISGMDGQKIKGRDVSIEVAKK